MCVCVCVCACVCVCVCVKTESDRTTEIVYGYMSKMLNSLAVRCFSYVQPRFSTCSKAAL